ncbi:hypothetical protein [Evansella cellulosilytica]|uniref:Nitroreductase n=1 Tax=Evansella cellulosilytica (strain ATCC 21833 / DSM 2522 / FERM P-1141 / JCM 9156 / N-4) TaxID=649639 RepID=E6TVK2_EVAC2|nr:hypothetical protein [Evansella cellulosilytica]ADU32130.1 hypothetical protein Bcell_3891 [Evansella cellulosilytica DSM 2522]
MFSFDMFEVIIVGFIYSIILSVLVVFIQYINPRILLQSYPKSIQEKVMGKSKKEQMHTKIFGSIFMILSFGIPLLYAIYLDNLYSLSYMEIWIVSFIIINIFNLVDLVIIDWIIICKVTPSFTVIPGTDGHPDYKNYLFHIKGFGAGVLFSIIGSLLIATIVYVLF